MPTLTIASSSFVNIIHFTVKLCQNKRLYQVLFNTPIMVSSSFADINHGIVDFRHYYQPLHGRALRILAIHCVVEVCQYRPFYRQVLPKSTNVSSSSTNNTHYVVKFCQYQPLCRHVSPMSTTASSSFANINHCIVKFCQYQPLCR